MPLNQKHLQFNKEKSILGKILKNTPLVLPSVLQHAPNLSLQSHEALGAVSDHEDIQRAFPKTYGRARISLQPTDVPFSTVSPLRVACVLSGGQAPGGHNVIAGLYDYVKKVNPSSVIIGFLDGPHGIYSGNYCVIDDEMMDTYRNTGGFDMICSGRHKIEKPAEFAAAMENCIALNLDGLVVIGGDDSNTNAAVLAEYFEANNCKTKVCGAPKTIDGDLKVDPYIPISFGFDTACRTYSEQIGNLCSDNMTSQRTYHFVRLMGRAASNIALECALQTRPNVCLISEEVEEKKLTLAQITQQVADVIVKRSSLGKDYGIVLLPEGLIEFIPEFNALISEINDVLAKAVEATEQAVVPYLSEHNKQLFAYLPDAIKQQLLLDRDPHGNVQVAKIETERLLAQTVQNELDNLTKAGVYKGSFSPEYHSYGYEGRSCFPSAFDMAYCYILGQTVGAMISLGCNGLICSVTNLTAPVSEWVCGGVPITMLCRMEKRHGHMKPVIKKALVELDGEPFKAFAAQRDDWAIYDLYRSPGPVQFLTGATSLELCITLSLELLKADPRMTIEDLAPAKQVQDAALKFGMFNNAPLVGDAAKILSPLQLQRSQFQPPVLPILKNGASGTGAGSISIVPASAPLSPLVLGVVIAGAAGPGAHDVISGIVDSLPAGSKVIGFVGGLLGLINGVSTEITAEKLAPYRGQGGCELLGQSFEDLSPDTFEQIAAVTKQYGLQGLVLLGGTKTIDATAHLNQYFTSVHVPTRVIVVPVDITGETINSFVEVPVGFDSFTKTASQIIGNNATDGASAKKYWYFMRIMGGESSYTTLECALKTKSNFVYISEEIKANNWTFADLINQLADTIQTRANDNKNFGTVLIPEGILTLIPEIAAVIDEIATYYSTSGTMQVDVGTILTALTEPSKTLFASMPDYVQAALLTPRIGSTAFDVSKVDTEKYLAAVVTEELAKRKLAGAYKASFSVVPSYIGYQARGTAPSNFDVTLAYNLGYLSTALVASDLSGYVATFTNLKEPFSTWIPGAVVAASAAHKSLVDLDTDAYKAYNGIKEDCKLVDRYENPGPLQFTGPDSVIDSVPYIITGL